MREYARQSVMGNTFTSKDVIEDNGFVKIGRPDVAGMRENYAHYNDAMTGGPFNAGFLKDPEFSIVSHLRIGGAAAIDIVEEGQAESLRFNGRTGGLRKGWNLEKYGPLIYAGRGKRGVKPAADASNAVRSSFVNGLNPAARFSAIR